jgi:hypothetical protein
MLNPNGTHTPTKVKAAGLALLLQGVPCRRVQKALGQLFPDTPPPHYSTISRWFQYSPSNRADTDRWWETVFLAGELLHRRLNSPELTTEELLMIVERINDFTFKHYDRFVGLQDATATPRAKSCCLGTTPL